MSNRGPVSIFAEMTAPAPRFLMRLSLLADLIETLPQPVGRFLEIGPGLGDVSAYLSRRFPRATGTLMDTSPQSVRHLAERFSSNPRLRALEGDFRWLPDAPQYDLLIACEVFEHIENDSSAFSAASRLLAPGGHFLFSAPAFMRKWQQVDEYAGHVRRYERSELIAKFKRHDLFVEQLWCYGFPVTALVFPMRQIYYLLRRNEIPRDKEVATQKSGVDRALARRFRRLPWAAVMTPFFWLQKRFRNLDLGDGFIVLARKPDSGISSADAP